MLLPTCGIERQKRKQIYRCFKNIEAVALARVMKRIFRITSRNVAFEIRERVGRAFMKMADSSGIILADKTDIVIDRILIHQSCMGEGMNNISVDTALAKKIRIQPAHIRMRGRRREVFRLGLRFFFTCRADFLSRTLAEQTAHSFGIGHSEELAKEFYSTAACLLVLAVPLIFPDRDLSRRGVPRKFLASALYLLAVNLQKPNDVCLFCKFLFLF